MSEISQKPEQNSLIPVSLKHSTREFPPVNQGQSRASILPQVFGGGVSALVQVSLGTVAGYSGVTLPQLVNGTSPDFSLDQQHVALFSSLLYLAAAAGCLIGMLPMVRYGQRIIMLMCLPLFFAGWLALGFSSSIWMLQSSRVLIGLTIGVIESASYQYTTEIAHSTVRGQMVGTLDTMRQMGVLFICILGITNLSWREMALVCGCTTVPVFIALIFLPDSPRWLATQGRLEEAAKSLSFYRGKYYDINPELSSITSQLIKNEETKKSFTDQLILMTEKKTLKVVSLLGVLLFAVQFTGNIVVLSYFVPIFQLANVSMNSYASVIIVSGIRVVATICSLLIVDRVGRRPALIVSFLACGLSLIIMGIFFYLKNLNINFNTMNWVPLTSMIIFMFFSCIGHPILNLVRGELLPTSVRSAAMPFLYAIFFGGMFLASHTYPLMASGIGEEGAFWVYGGVCIAMVVSVALVIPETRNKNLENINMVSNTLCHDQNYGN